MRETDDSRPLSECGQWLSGGTPKTTVPEYWGGDVPWITSGSLTQFYLDNTDRTLTPEGVRAGSRLVPENTILFVVRGMSLLKEFRVGITTRPMAFGQDCKAIVPAPGVDCLYLANALRAAAPRILGMVSQAAHGTGRLPTDQIGALSIRIPALEEQRHIAASASAFDDLIANNNRRIEILEEMARAIYRQWFVEFRYPGHEDVPLVESKLGQIPEGWEISLVGDLADLYRGRSYRTVNLMKEGGYLFANLKCIARDGGFRRSGLKRYEGPLKESQKARRGDIVVALTDVTQERRIVARAARIPDLGEEQIAMSMDLAKLVPAAAEDGTFLYSMLRFSSFPDEVKEYANGANVLHLNPRHINDYRFPAPPSSLRVSFGDLVEPMYSLMEKLESQAEILRRTRDLLLPKLVAGEIDVSDLDLDEVA